MAAIIAVFFRRDLKEKRNAGKEERKDRPDEPLRSKQSCVTGKIRLKGVLGDEGPEQTAKQQEKKCVLACAQASWFSIRSIPASMRDSPSVEISCAAAVRDLSSARRA